MIRFALVLAVLLLAQAPADAQSWRTYTNARFGTVATVPRDWSAGREPENGDGLAFVAPDGQATITVSGNLHVWDSAEEAMEIMDEARDGATITYRRRGKRLLVLSSTRGDTIFYRKSILSCGDRIWNNLTIEYPKAHKVAYDSLVTHVAGSLRFGGKSAQILNCK